RRPGRRRSRLTLAQVKRRSTRAKKPPPSRIVYSRWDSKRKLKVMIKRYRDAALSRAERIAMRSLPPSPYLVRYLGYYTRKRRGYLVMEWVKGRSLETVARRHGPFERGRVIDLAVEVLEGIDVVHRAGFV